MILNLLAVSVVHADNAGRTARGNAQAKAVRVSSVGARASRQAERLLAQASIYRLEGMCMCQQDGHHILTCVHMLVIRFQCVYVQHIRNATWHDACCGMI